MGGRYGNPRTCKGIFRHMSHRLAQLDADGRPVERNLHRTVSDYSFDGPDSEGDSEALGPAYDKEGDGPGKHVRKGWKGNGSG